MHTYIILWQLAICIHVTIFHGSLDTTFAESLQVGVQKEKSSSAAAAASRDTKVTRPPVKRAASPEAKSQKTKIGKSDSSTVAKSTAPTSSSKAERPSLTGILSLDYLF